MLLAPIFVHAVALTTTLHEGFDYIETNNPDDDTRDGDIFGNNGGTGFGEGNWGVTSTGGLPNSTLNVITPGLAFSGLATTGGALQLNATTTGRDENFFRPLNQALDAGTFYFSFLVRKDLEGLRTINLAFYGVGPNSSFTTERVAVGQFGGRSTSSMGNFAVAQFNSVGSGPLTFAPAPTSFESGPTYLLVGRIEFNVSGQNDMLTLYVNPTVGKSEPAIPSLQTAAEFDYGAITHVRPFSGGSQVGSVLPAIEGTFDEIRLGPTYASVTVPEPGSWALLGMTASCLLLRRRRV